MLPRRIGHGIALALLFTVCVAQADTVVHGHRGARGERPENTLAAFQHALEIGVDVLELDVVISRDNQPTINHDLWVNAELCTRNGKPIAPRQAVRSFTLAQLRQFDCGSLPNPRFPQQVLQPGQHIASLAELFQLVVESPLPNAANMRFNIETKIKPRHPELTPDPEQFARLLLKVIADFKLEHRVTIQSFDYRTLKWTKLLAPEISLSQLTFRNYVNLVPALRSIDARVISPDWQSITAEMVAEFHTNNIRVAPWTANTPEAWNYLLEIGVDEIITDYPSALMEYLRQKNLRSARDAHVHP